MQIVVKTKNDCADRVKLDCSPVEWMLINSALRKYSELAHEKDKAKLQEMCDTKPLIKKSANNLADDGTFIVPVDDYSKVKRVLVYDNKQNGGLFYADR